MARAAFTGFLFAAIPKGFLFLRHFEDCRFLDVAFLTYIRRHL